MTNTLAADVDTMGQWRQLLVLLSGSFVVTLDFFIVNVAVPTLQVDLDAWAPTPTDVASAAASSHLVLAALMLVVTIALALLTCRRADESLPHG